ncbi:MAG TPA: TonB-dependent receptor plug domain-containing protein, partial [Chloroflexota bacterium]|nr:TonB-dependent receptor plug domain-containing protein [Chloroflexota bacterium]
MNNGRGRLPRRMGARTILSLLGLLLLFAVPATAQHRITGRVTEEGSGAPLSGVQISVQGTGVGTLTDADGRYTLVAPTSSGVLVFNRIGYAALRVPFNGQNVLDARMATEATQLEGIVVIGYGERARANLTESVGTVSAQEIQRVTVASPDAAIQGRVTGVQVTAESGTPGAPVAMRVRGVGTVGNTQPLFVIDGVPVGKGAGANQSPLATINPNDIESISILKDASAASVYGMQAANGVVLITTRRGRLGAPTIRYDGYTGVQQMPRYYDVLPTEEWLALQQEAIDANNAFFGRTPSDAAYVQLPPQLRQGAPERAELLARNTDWTRIGINNNAPITNHNVSISGASDEVNYYVSGGYFQQQALIGQWDLSRYSFRANSDFNVT